MIRFKEMRWSNVFSYGPNNKINFSEQPLLQLIGKNGNGKTSIALILEEVLFNKNSKGIKKAAILNRYSKEKHYTIELDFNIGDDEYTIATRRGSTQTVSLTKNGQDVSAHTATGTYKFIEDLLGWDHKKFTQIVNQSSASSLEFLTATDSNRKKFLIELLDLTQYITAGDHFKDKAKELENELKIAQGKLSVVQTLINNTKDTTLVRKIVPAPLVQDLTGLQKNIASIEHTLTTITEQNKKIVQNNKYKEILDSIILPVLGQKPEDNRQTLLAEKAQNNAYASAAKKIIAKFENLRECCPTCDQKIDTTKVVALLNENKLIATHASVNNKSIDEQVSAIEQSLNAWDAKKKIHIDYEQYHSLYDATMPNKVLDRDALISEKVSLQTKQEGMLREATTRGQEISSALAWNARVDAAEEQLNKAKSQKDILLVEESGIKAKKALMDVLVKTFSTSGLVAYKIECLVKDLEELTNKYLAEFSDGRFQITFQLNGSDKLNVIITDNGNDVEIVELSNGERARVNISALLAIRKLLQDLSSNQTNLLFLDEVIENLDVHGKEKLVEVLLEETHLNTVLVSHGFTHPLLEKVSVVKDNNISRIE